MAGRVNGTGTYGIGAARAQASSKNAARPLARHDNARNLSAHFANPSQRTTGGNSYSGGFTPGNAQYYPERARAVRSAGYGQGLLPSNPKAAYRPNAPYHVGTPANLQRKEFDNWSAKKKSVQGEFGTSSAIVYWGDYRERDEKMRSMRERYALNDVRRALIQEAFNKLDSDGDGVVSQSDIRRMYDVKSHPLYKSGTWSEDQVYYDVLARLKGNEYEAGATQACLQLTLKEFEAYYEKVGEELDDDYFAAMIIQAWRLYKVPRGFNPIQGWGAPVLEHVALVEANLSGDDYPGPAKRNMEKLAHIKVEPQDAKMIADWEAAVNRGQFTESLKAAEQICAYVEKAEKLEGFPMCPHPLHANAVRFVRQGGAQVLTQLARAQDTLIKRACANAMFACFKDELPREELSKGDVRWLQGLLRDGLPSIVACEDAVARNKAERVRVLLV